MCRLRFVFAFWLLLIPIVQAEEVPKEHRAEEMLSLCKGKISGQDKGLQSMVCTFRLQGVVSIMIENCLSVSEGFNPIHILASEIPPSKGAARQAYINFMEANPDKWGLPWHIAVTIALSEAFPCKR